MRVLYLLVVGGIIGIFALGCEKNTFDGVFEARSYCNTKSADVYDASYHVLSTAFKTPAEYLIALEFGKEKQRIAVVPDTGSSDLVVAHADCATCSTQYGRYQPSSGVLLRQGDFSVHYGSGSGTAQAFYDEIGLPCDIEPIGYTFGALTHATDLPYNILGLAYDNLIQDPSYSVRSFFSQYVSNRSIPNQFSMLLCGQRPGSAVTLGGQDPRVSESELRRIPMTQELFYQVAVKALRVGTNEIPLGHGRAIIDSGTTVNLIPETSYWQLVEELKKTQRRLGVNFGDGFFKGIGFQVQVVSISDSVVSQFPPVQVVLLGELGKEVVVEIPPEVYLKDWDGSGGSGRIFGFGIGASSPFILGQVFMEATYVAFLRNEKRIGLFPSKDLCGTHPISPRE